MTRDQVQSWLDAYVRAWLAYDREQTAALFAEDVAYRFHPHDEPIVGRDAVVEAWLGESDNPQASERDEPGTYRAHYEPVAVDGDTAVAVGSSHYTDADGNPTEAYDNCFVMRFDAEGRCREFTEWFVKRP
jgi:ketosteroid isomerase-like protein